MIFEWLLLIPLLRLVVGLIGRALLLLGNGLVVAGTLLVQASYWRTQEPPDYRERLKRHGRLD